MYLSEEQITGFVGTGEVNADGDSLSAFLEKYDPNRYQKPSNTVDTIVFTYTEEDGVKQIGKVLLIKRGNHPCIGWWALPGGFVDYKENLDIAALRELEEETGVKDIEVCQLKSYGDYDRDPRMRVITTAYVALIPEGSVKAKAGDDASDSGWFDIKEEIISQNTVEAFNISRHKLTLTNGETGLCVSAEVEIKDRINVLLPQTKYSVASTDLIAADHGAIILEGYHFVKEQLKAL